MVARPGLPVSRANRMLSAEPRLLAAKPSAATTA